MFDFSANSSLNMLKKFQMRLLKVKSIYKRLGVLRGEMQEYTAEDRFPITNPKAVGRLRELQHRIERKGFSEVFEKRQIDGLV